MGMRALLAPYLPILSWARTYQRGWWGRDAIAGLTLWGLVVPEGMAYAGIAGLPPQAGLYTLVLSLAIYALMGTSRHLSAEPTSATAALFASSVSAAVIATAADADEPGTCAASAAAFVLVTGLFWAAGKPCPGISALAVDSRAGRADRHDQTVTLSDLTSPGNTPVRQFGGQIRLAWAAPAVVTLGE